MQHPRQHLVLRPLSPRDLPTHSFSPLCPIHAKQHMGVRRQQPSPAAEADEWLLLWARRGNASEAWPTHSSHLNGWNSRWPNRRADARRLKTMHPHTLYFSLTLSSVDSLSPLFDTSFSLFHYSPSFSVFSALPIFCSSIVTPHFLNKGIQHLECMVNQKRRSI